MNRSFCVLGVIASAVCTLATQNTHGQSMQLLSVRDPSLNAPAGGNGDSVLPLITPDGRFVLFASTANDLVLTTNGLPIPTAIPPRLNVYLRDRLSNTTALVSVNITGTNGGDGDSLPCALSSNGLYALFESAASDLFGNDTNKTRDIFVRDLLNGTTTLVTAGTNGVNANGASRSAVMTPDGRYVAFVSLANNLVPSDTNKVADVFVRDLLTQTTTLVSSNASVTTSAPFSNSSESPRITPDGRYVTFLSSCTNLLSGITTTNDVYVRDTISGTTVWASANARAVLQSVFGSPNGSFYNPAISADGKFIAFEGSTNSNSRFATAGVIFRFNRETSTHVQAMNIDQSGGLDGGIGCHCVERRPMGDL